LSSISSSTGFSAFPFLPSDKTLIFLSDVSSLRCFKVNLF